jgi:hypothetical protein
MFISLYRCNRNPLHQLSRFSSAPMRSKFKPWTQEEKNKVYEFASGKSSIKDSEWIALAKRMGRTYLTMKDYWARNQSVWHDRKVGAWTLQEDQTLLEVVDRVGSIDFKAVAQLVSKRNYAQCRSRMNVIRDKDLRSYNPDRDNVDFHWTNEEMALLENG